MTAPILVTGGTGLLGRHLVPLLQRSGAEVRVLSRGRRALSGGVEHVTADLRDGSGLDGALAGAGTVVHLAGAQKGDDEVARTLVRAAADADVRHLVFISVIGADRVPIGWMRSKLAAEQVIAGSGLPWTTLRAAQFHDLVAATLRTMAKSPLMPAPGGLRFQPVDVRDVADRLAELAVGSPAGRVRDLAGPRVYPFPDLARSYLQVRGARRALLPIRIPGRAGRAYRAGDNLALDGADLGTRTWEAFLADLMPTIGAGRHVTESDQI